MLKYRNLDVAKEKLKKTVSEYFSGQIAGWKAAIYSRR